MAASPQKEKLAAITISFSFFTSSTESPNMSARPQKAQSGRYPPRRRSPLPATHQIAQPLWQCCTPAQGYMPCSP